jgi:hypothetical protein
MAVLKRYWVVFLLAGLFILLVVGSVVVNDVGSGASGSFQDGYDYAMKTAPSATASRQRSERDTALAHQSLATSTSTVFDRCTTAAQSVAPASDTRTKWRTGCVAGWDKKTGHPTAGTEGMTTTT